MAVIIVILVLSLDTVGKSTTNTLSW
jgi:hypothetical protein